MGDHNTCPSCGQDSMGRPGTDCGSPAWNHAPFEDPSAEGGAIQVTTTTEHVHAIHLVAPEGNPFRFTTQDDVQIAAKGLIVSVTTHDDGTVRPLQTRCVALGVAVDKDGNPGRAKRRFETGNLTRLPVHLMKAVLDAADGLGVTGLREDTASLRRPTQNGVGA